MRAALAALLGSTALLGLAGQILPVAAQGQPAVTQDVVPAGQAQAKAAIAACDRLINYIEESRPTGAASVDQARTWLQASDATSCQRELDRLAEANQTGSAPANRIATTPGTAPQLNPAAGLAPAVPNVPAASPAAPAQVLVQQQQPNVTVRQAQPEIIVRMPPPVITVQQAQPEIIVRMPEPDVNVAMAQPQVQVTMPQPQVQVQPPSPQSQANVQVERQQPNVRYERTGEPQIIYRQAEGQPQIRFEPVGAAGGTGTTSSSTAPREPTGAASQQSAQAQLNGGQPGYGTSLAAEARASLPAVPQTTGALAAPMLTMPVSRLEDMTLYNAREEKLGEVEAVMAGPGGGTFAVVSYGGFLGLGERRVAIPMESLAMRGDRLLTDALTDDQLKGLPDFERNAGYREIEGAQTAQLRVLR